MVSQTREGKSFMAPKFDAKKRSSFFECSPRIPLANLPISDSFNGEEQEPGQGGASKGGEGGLLAEAMQCEKGR